MWLRLNLQGLGLLLSGQRVSSAWGHQMVGEVWAAASRKSSHGRSLVEIWRAKPRQSRQSPKGQLCPHFTWMPS